MANIIDSEVSLEQDVTFWLGHIRVTIEGAVSLSSFQHRLRALGFADGTFEEQPGLGLAVDKNGRGVRQTEILEPFQNLNQITWGGAFVLDATCLEYLKVQMLLGRDPTWYEGPLAGRPGCGLVHLASMHTFPFADGDLHLLTFVSRSNEPRR